MKEDVLLKIISSRSRNGAFCMSRHPVTSEDDLKGTSIATSARLAAVRGILCAQFYCSIFPPANRPKNRPEAAFNN
ncbi:MULTISPECIES: hypothetical protein [Cronobacter]|uniref:hypothetical protein n=1 Tax=Cronobacter TaxID=413496 RepID=UPI00105679A9|nr:MULTISPECIES: hypothetical protein [Cronobacter]EJH4501905.1 hypothetical protein [Cronobacter sakazakii]EJV9474753.1 hypothetical protein [Cronobacter sakazakii]NCH41201.1 hypothetical protein [Cronobacter sakazakii]NCH53514.1 hypothetical protein [Cronobacter muytjensii]HDK7323771.1 hypothetical protein [Cronobacter sakazakii]